MPGQVARMTYPPANRGGYGTNVEYNLPQGGGFMPEAQGLSQSYDSPAKRSGGLNAQSLRPVTIKQLLEANQPAPDGNFRIDNSEISQVSIVACVRSIKELSTGIDYLLEDGTGAISGRCWPDKLGSEPIPRERTWVRVFGMLRSMQNNRNLNIFSIRSITEFDEITLHMLNALHCHYYYSKGPISKGPSAPSGLGNGYATPAPGGYGQQSGYDNSLSPIQQAVLGLYRSNPATEGVHIMSVVRGLQGRYPENEIRSTVNWLSNEGYLYETIDSDHHRDVHAS